MQVIRGIDSAQFAGVVLTIGNFDGVHRGHQTILETARERANRIGTRLVVMTFDPHPSAVLKPEHAPEVITPLPEKLRCMEAAGVDVVVLVHATPDFLSITCEDFIQRIILARFAPVAMVEGVSFGFGRRRQGDVNTLRDAAAKSGFELEVVEPISVALGGHTDTIISSSVIRHLLACGTVGQAAMCLGRPYRLFGQVVKGAERGRKMGVPTANLRVESQLIPAEGVYAGRAELDGRCVPAAISIGRTPTFETHQLLVEAHFPGFEGDLYGAHIFIDFLAWLRRQERFDSAEVLYRQIEKDISEVRDVLAVYPNHPKLNVIG
ncbi:MAG: bifunctional riboflavin kinase/FAD synthetase [Phycisphaerales bacterium]|nr:bifunctional riboflavin kinase/FAD synthetase [Phycisphaerales bacterium]